MLSRIDSCTRSRANPFRSRVNEITPPLLTTPNPSVRLHVLLHTIVVVLRALNTLLRALNVLLRALNVLLRHPSRLADSDRCVCIERETLPRAPPRHSLRGSVLAVHYQLRAVRTSSTQNLRRYALTSSRDPGMRGPRAKRGQQTRDHSSPCG
jgi:hypothetical protein